MAEQLGGNPPDGTIAPGLHKEINASGGATRVLKAEESGGTFLFDAATGVAYELPPPVVGMQFDFLATVSVTSNAHAVATDAATTFVGGAINQVIAASGTSEGQVATVASDVTISMNGSTTGGLQGTYLHFECISATTWYVTGIVVGSGTLSTPFA